MRRLSPSRLLRLLPLRRVWRFLAARRVTVLLLMAVAAGCRSNSDLVEAELRTRDSQVRDLRDKLYRSQACNGALERELHDLHQGGAARLPPEVAAQVYTVKDIMLARQTGGYNEDGQPGDEALQVVVEPRDTDGQAIKAPGALHVTALEISPQGLKTPIGIWDVPPDQLRRTWKNGLFATGYFVVLPWKTCPASERLRVVVQFTLADGRLFETDRDVTIRLPPGASRLAPGEHLPNPTPFGPGPVLELPPAGPAKGKRSPTTISLRPAELMSPIPWGGPRP